MLKIQTENKKKIRTCHKNEENVQKMIKVCSATV